MARDLISIILISKNDFGLENTLHSLEKEISKPCKVEILVVDASKGRLDSIKKQHPKVKWINYKSNGKKISIPHQRNIGVTSAKGNIVVFIDSSCIPVKDWLFLLYKRFSEGEKIVAGKVVPSDKKVINNISRPYSNKVKYIEECPTANVLIDREIFQKVGLFDESFEYGSDTDLMWRSRDAGYKIYYEPLALVTHDWGDHGQRFKRSFNYGRGRMRLYLKHKGRIKKILRNDPILVVYPLFIAFLPLTVIFPFYPLLIIIPMVKNKNNKPIYLMGMHLAYAIGALSMIYSNLKNFFKIS